MFTVSNDTPCNRKVCGVSLKISHEMICIMKILYCKTCFINKNLWKRTLECSEPYICVFSVHLYFFRIIERVPLSSDTCKTRKKQDLELFHKLTYKHCDDDVGDKDLKTLKGMNKWMKLN